MYIIFALLSAVFASLVAIFAKLGLKNIDVTLATTIRAFIMFIFLSIVIFLSGKINLENLKAISAKDWGLIALSGIAGAVSWLFYFAALKIGENNTSKVAAIDRLSIVFVLIFAVLLLHEKIEFGTIVGIILMSLGAVFIALS